MTKAISAALDMHRKNKGKMEILSKVPLEDNKDLSLAYSPGVAEPCLEIAKNPSAVYDYTLKGNLVGVVTDGSAVLGLGDIGPEAALPVMEGKALLLKKFANIDAFPICLNTQNVDEIVNVVQAMSPTFGGINLEDIAAPRCFEIERRLREVCDIPVFHDDQHGTAIVVGAGLYNALKLTNRKVKETKIVVNGAGAAGIAIVKLLKDMGFQHIIMCDSKGIIYKGRTEGMNEIKEDIAEMTNNDRIEGTLEDALHETDVFIGVSIANLLTKEMIANMKDKPIVFALANPVPELWPEQAKEFGVSVIATGRSDYPNQINNVLAFPGIFRGALDVRATDINEQMKLAAVYAIASLVKEEELTEDYIIPNAFDVRISNTVAKAVSEAARASNLNQI